MSDEIPAERPIRTRITHLYCGSVTELDHLTAVALSLDPASETLACCNLCDDIFPAYEFEWDGTREAVGS
jgi:hypothetical protein